MQCPGPPGKPPPGAGDRSPGAPRAATVPSHVADREVAAAIARPVQCSLSQSQLSSFFCKGEEWILWKK
jgi:hypothetical protein